MVQVLNDFIAILVGGIVDLAEGLASGVAAMATKLFLVEDPTTHALSLSSFGGLVALFAGIALAVGITTKVYIWITSLGN